MRYRTSRFIGIVSLLLIAGVSVGSAVELHVGPSGHDGDPGTPDRPLATLAGARDTVRRLLAGGVREDVTVWFDSGQFRLAETVVFGLPDSAKPDQTITYRAQPGAIPVFSSDVPLRHWRRLDERLEGLAPSAHGEVWMASLPEGLESCTLLFDSDGMLPRARTAGLAHTRELAQWRSSEEFHTLLPLPMADLRQRFLPHPQHAEILVIGTAPWTMNILPVKSVDEVSGLARLAVPSTYALAKPRFGPTDNCIWIENTFAGLDGPGKWVIDPEARRVYLWPRGDRPGEDIAAARLVEFIRVEGAIDAEGPTDRPVRGLIFRGLTFRHGKRFDSAGQTGLGLQHDWERFDAATAMLRLRAAEECAVEQCRFEDSGGAGIRLDLHAQRNRIVGNEIARIGGTGILLAGYGPGVKDVNRDNVVTDNHIHHIGGLWWHSIGVWAWQSGHNRIACNHIHHVPYTAIAVTGRINWDRSGVGECSRTVRWREVAPATGQEPWEQRERFLHGRENRIEHNDIHDVMEKMNDGNGIYISGAGRANVARRNFIHDVTASAVGEAIRCDDDQHETLIEKNVIFRFGAHGTGLCSKGHNHIINNIVACPPGRVVRGMISIEPDARSSNHAGSRIERNIFYATQGSQPFVFRDILSRGNPPAMATVDMDRNLYFNASDPNAADEYLAWARRYGREQNSLHADPMFTDAASGDFRLKPGSPAVALGFEPIDLSQSRTRPPGQ